MTWADVAQPLLGGLAAILAVQLTEGMLDDLRRRGACPRRWSRER